MFLRPDAEDDDGGREGLPEEEQQDAQPRGDKRGHGVLGGEEPFVPSRASNECSRRLRENFTIIEKALTLSTRRRPK